MADLQEDLAKLKKAHKKLIRDYILLSGLYGRLLLLTSEEPCTHTEEQNCWHKNRIAVIRNFPAQEVQDGNT